MDYKLVLDIFEVVFVILIIVLTFMCGCKNQDNRRCLGDNAGSNRGSERLTYDIIDLSIKISLDEVMFCRGNVALLFFIEEQ